MTNKTRTIILNIVAFIAIFVCILVVAYVLSVPDTPSETLEIIDQMQETIESSNQQIEDMKLELQGFPVEELIEEANRLLDKI